MKKALSLIMACALIFAFVFATGIIAGADNTQVAAELRPDFKIIINDKNQTFTDANGAVVYPVLYNGTTYLPLRAVGGALGMTVGWDGATQTVTLDNASEAAANAPSPSTSSSQAQTTPITAELRPDFKIIINGEVQAFTDANKNTVYPLLYNGTTYLPLRAVGGALGMTVGWDGATQTVTLSASEAPAAETPAAETPAAETPSDSAPSTDSKWITGSAGFGSAYAQKNPPQSTELKLVNEYKWTEDIFGTKYYYVALVVENISDKTLQVDAHITLENSYGEQTLSREKTARALAPGAKRAIYVSQDSPISVYSYGITSYEDEDFSDGTSQLKVETFKGEDKITVKVKNTGSEAVKNVEYFALFFVNGRVVNYDFGYCVDENKRIQPEATEFDDAYCFDDFDNVEVFVWGEV